jgi:hypothetical protein
MEQKDVAYVIRTIEGWYEDSPEAPAPPMEVVAFLRELVVGLRELPPTGTEVQAETLANIVSSGLGAMPGDW